MSQQQHGLFLTTLLFSQYSLGDACLQFLLNLKVIVWSKLSTLMFVVFVKPKGDCLVQLSTLMFVVYVFCGQLVQGLEMSICDF